MGPSHHFGGPTWRRNADCAAELHQFRTDRDGPILSRRPHNHQRLSGDEPPTATRLRHKDLLAEALARLEHALAVEGSPELAAEDVRLAGRALDRITGRIDPEDVLDRVFATFCIGK